LLQCRIDEKNTSCAHVPRLSTRVPSCSACRKRRGAPAMPTRATGLYVRMCIPCYITRTPTYVGTTRTSSPMDDLLSRNLCDPYVYQF
jgi:hypothetical protein